MNGKRLTEDRKHILWGWILKKILRDYYLNSNGTNLRLVLIIALEVSINERSNEGTVEGTFVLNEIKARAIILRHL